MTGSPPSGPAPPHALRAGDHKRPPDPLNPGRKDPRLTHLPSPPSIPCAERRRRGQGPSAAHAVGPRGPIPDPDTATSAAQNRRRTTEKRSTIRISPSLTRPAPFRDDNASTRRSPSACQPAPCRRSHRRPGRPRPSPDPKKIPAHHGMRRTSPGDASSPGTTPPSRPYSPNAPTQHPVQTPVRKQPPLQRPPITKAQHHAELHDQSPPGLCAALDRRHRPHQRQAPGTAHNPALLIGLSGLTRPGQPVPALRVRCLDGPGIPRGLV
jgi:hypothetical protein